MEEEAQVELDPPDGIEDAETSVEVLRAWIADGALLVSLNSSAFGDQVRDWGRLLAEVGHHVAKAAALNGFMLEEEAQTALREAFVANFETTPGPTSGKLRGQTKH
jgi:Domain of unknown function (DUF5076)